MKGEAEDTVGVCAVSRPILHVLHESHLTKSTVNPKVTKNTNNRNDDLTLNRIISRKLQAVYLSYLLFFLQF